MSGANQELNQTAGADMAPHIMPEDVRLTLLATVTERIIKIRHQTQGVVSTYELSRLIPAAQWLTGDGDQSGKFRALGAIYQYEVEAVSVDEFGHVERVDDDSRASTFGVYRRPRYPQENAARAEFLGDFNSRYEAAEAAIAMAQKDAGGAGEH